MMLESPRKKVGVLFKVPDKVTEDLSVIRGEIAANWGRFSKSAYISLEKEGGYRAFFAPGVPWEHYDINTYMNKLINGEPTTAGTTRTTRTSGATIVASTEPISKRSSVFMPYN
eukprot:sb/3476894/